MNCNEIILRALKPVGFPIEQDEYNGKEKTFLIFSYQDIGPVFYADDVPVEISCSVLIQLICPKEYNYFAKQKEITRFLMEAGFSYPDITIFYDSDMKKRRIAFACHITLKEDRLCMLD